MRKFSSSAGIATFFEAIALKGTLLSKHPNPQGLSGFPKSARIVRRPKALQANALTSCDHRLSRDRLPAQKKPGPFAKVPSGDLSS
jgi:hypothetical protein